MKKKFLKPKKETLELEGNISYAESNRAWSVIRFKDQLIREFPQLKKRRDKFGYKLLMHRNYADLLEEIKKIKSEEEAIPILLWMCKKESS